MVLGNGFRSVLPLLGGAGNATGLTTINILGDSEEEVVEVPVTSLAVLVMTSGLDERIEEGAAGAVGVRENGCRERERDAEAGAFNVVSIELLDPRGLCLFEGERVILEKKDVGPVVSTVLTPEVDDVEGLRALRWEEEEDSTMTRPINERTKITQFSETASKSAPGYPRASV